MCHVKFAPRYFNNMIFDELKIEIASDVVAVKLAKNCVKLAKYIPCTSLQYFYFSSLSASIFLYHSFRCICAVFLSLYLLLATYPETIRVISIKMFFISTFHLMAQFRIKSVVRMCHSHNSTLLKHKKFRCFLCLCVNITLQRSLAIIHGTENTHISEAILEALSSDFVIYSGNALSPFDISLISSNRVTDCNMLKYRTTSNTRQTKIKDKYKLREYLFVVEIFWRCQIRFN